MHWTKRSTRDLWAKALGNGGRKCGEGERKRVVHLLQPESSAVSAGPGRTAGRAWVSRRADAGWRQPAAVGTAITDGGCATSGADQRAVLLRPARRRRLNASTSTWRVMGNGSEAAMVYRMKSFRILPRSVPRAVAPNATYVYTPRVPGGSSARYDTDQELSHTHTLCLLQPLLSQSLAHIHTRTRTRRAESREPRA